jgi:hypothetical protein
LLQISDLACNYSYYLLGGGHCNRQSEEEREIEGKMAERYVKLTKDQAEAPLEDIRPGELNLPVHVPQV